MKKMDLPNSSSHNDLEKTVSNSTLLPDVLPEFQAWENASDHDLITFENNLPDE